MRDRFAVRRTIGEILDAVDAAKENKDKVEILRTYASDRLKLFLKYALDPSIKFMLPPGVPKYRVNPGFRPGSSSSELFNEMKRMYVLLAPHPTEKFHPGLSKDNPRNQMKREQIFVGMLESFYPAESNYLIQMKEKTLTCVSPQVVDIAFPGLLANVEHRKFPEIPKDAPSVSKTPDKPTEKPMENPPKIQKTIKTQYNNIGRCQLCGDIHSEMTERHLNKEKFFSVKCLGCQAETAEFSKKGDAIQAFRNIAKTRKRDTTEEAGPKGKGEIKNGLMKPKGSKKKAQKTIKEKNGPMSKSIIIEPTQEDVDRLSVKPYPNQTSFTEEVEEDLSGIEPAKPAFIPPEIENKESEEEIIEG